MSKAFGISIHVFRKCLAIQALGDVHRDDGHSGGAVDVYTSHPTSASEQVETTFHLCDSVCTCALLRYERRRGYSLRSNSWLVLPGKVHYAQVFPVLRGYMSPSVYAERAERCLKPRQAARTGVAHQAISYHRNER